MEDFKLKLIENDIISDETYSYKLKGNEATIFDLKKAFTDEEDTTYDLLLKQQQLYLQWQLENQNKVSDCQN